MTLKDRIQRDTRNAAMLPEAAGECLKNRKRFAPQQDMVRGISGRQLQISHQLDNDARALRSICDHPFHAMVEVQVKTSRGAVDALWYANQNIEQNQVIPVDGHDINVLAWTHPGFQLALSGKLNKWLDLKRSGFAIRGVSPRARARYTALTPSVAGLYDPGGAVRTTPGAPLGQAGLKAVKLEMTPEQVAAFVARMNGLLMVTGAPGTGKTTIAFQRIRFLFDQQNLRDVDDRIIEYSPALTRVFLGSKNLIEYSRTLLKKELDIVSDVVSFVPDFISAYVESTWQARENARPITRQMDQETLKAREAMLNLCATRDLKGFWGVLEKQALDRLRRADEGEWITIGAEHGRSNGDLARALGKALATVPTRTTGDPLGSWARMDGLWTSVRMSYTACRTALPERHRDRFDRAFVAWLFWVFDPIDVLHEYFSQRQDEAAARIARGTMGRLKASSVVTEMLGDWEKRLYGTNELSWIAWLWRFVLPEEAAQDDGFRGVPRSIPQPEHRTARRWTHVVIDEAQDLAVQEASLLASFVHPKGALTVSADFHQVVSPVHGMTDGEALKVGLPIWDQKLHLVFPFQRNLRQSREISQFLRGYYQSAFSEFPPFDAGDREEGIKPQLFVGAPTQFPKLIGQMMGVFIQSQSLRHVAVLQVHEDLEAIAKLRRSLETLDVPLAAPDAMFEQGKLVITSVERAKGLEFDACIVIGLDDVERGAMNFAKNRAYVALSRPTRRLFMLCQRDPVLLHSVQRSLFDRRIL